MWRNRPAHLPHTHFTHTHFLLPPHATRATWQYCKNICTPKKKKKLAHVFGLFVRSRLQTLPVKTRAHKLMRWDEWWSMAINIGLHNACATQRARARHTRTSCLDRTQTSQQEQKMRWQRLTAQAIGVVAGCGGGHDRLSRDVETASEAVHHGWLCLEEAGEESVVWEEKLMTINIGWLMMTSAGGCDEPKRGTHTTHTHTCTKHPGRKSEEGGKKSLAGGRIESRRRQVVPARLGLSSPGVHLILKIGLWAFVVLGRAFVLVADI